MIEVKSSSELANRNLKFSVPEIEIVIRRRQPNNNLFIKNPQFSLKPFGEC